MPWATGEQNKKEPSGFPSKATKPEEAIISQFSDDQPSGESTRNSAEVLQEHPTGCMSLKKLPTDRKKSPASPQCVGQFQNGTEKNESLIIKTNQLKLIINWSHYDQSRAFSCGYQMILLSVRISVDHNQEITRTEQRPSKSSDYTHLQRDSNYTVPDFGKWVDTFNIEFASTRTSLTPNANLRNNKSAHL